MLHGLLLLRSQFAHEFRRPEKNLEPDILAKSDRISMKAPLLSRHRLTFPRNAAANTNTDPENALFTVSSNRPRLISPADGPACRDQQIESAGTAPRRKFPRQGAISHAASARPAQAANHWDPEILRRNRTRLLCQYRQWGSGTRQEFQTRENFRKSWRLPLRT